MDENADLIDHLQYNHPDEFLRFVGDRLEQLHFYMKNAALMLEQKNELIKLLKEQLKLAQALAKPNEN